MLLLLGLGLAAFGRGNADRNCCKTVDHRSVRIEGVYKSSGAATEVASGVFRLEHCENEQAAG